MRGLGNIIPEHTQELGLVGDHSRILIRLNHDEFQSLQTAIVVEMWDHKRYGRGKRAWLKEFNEAERKKAGSLHSRFYGYYMRTGVPRHVVLSVDTIHFIKRLVNFFGTL